MKHLRGHKSKEKDMIIDQVRWKDFIPSNQHNSKHLNTGPSILPSFVLTNTRYLLLLHNDIICDITLNSYDNIYYIISVIKVTIFTLL